MATDDLKFVSFDGNAINDGSNYSSGFDPGNEWGLPPVTAQFVPRTQDWPLVSGVSRNGRIVTFFIKIVDVANIRTRRDELMLWFDPDDETPKALVIEDSDGANDRYVNAICESLIPVVGRTASDVGFAAVMAVHGDVRWRATSSTTHVWAITASGDTVVVNNAGTADAFPAYTVTPTAAKSSEDFPYRQFFAIRWRNSVAFKNYPTDIVNNAFDTATLVSGSKMQADGDDLRTEIDGVEVADRWLQDMNDATTQVWMNLDFQPKWEGTITAAIGSGDTVTSITVNESTAKAPGSGILVINSEIFTYTAKVDATKTFTIATRAEYNSSAANHSLGDTIWWCQHSVFVKYGDATVAAPSADDNKKPIFLLSSTNASWIYQQFKEDDGLRTGAWATVAVSRSPHFYGGNRGAEADPWDELGIDRQSAAGRFVLYNPSGITDANFTNGEKYADNLSDVWTGEIQSSKDGKNWLTEDTIADPSVAATWEAWSDNEVITAGKTHVALYLKSHSSTEGNKAFLEAADCTITLNSSNTPAFVAPGEAGGYAVSALLANATTGKTIGIDHLTVVDDDIVIDTDAKTVQDGDGNNQFQALTLTGGARRDWLKLSPGNNTLQYTDVGIDTVTVQVSYEKRYY